MKVDVVKINEDIKKAKAEKRLKPPCCFCSINNCKNCTKVKNYKPAEYSTFKVVTLIP